VSECGFDGGRRHLPISYASAWECQALMRKKSASAEYAFQRQYALTEIWNGDYVVTNVRADAPTQRT
jgi:hypothetical protein